MTAASSPPLLTPRHSLSEGPKVAAWEGAVPLLLSLYFLATSRWGSYLTIPGAPFFIGDLLLGLSMVGLLLALRRGSVALHSLVKAPLVVHLTLSLAAWAATRALLGGTVTLVALRDLAPYVYALAILPAFLLPVQSPARWTPVIYSVLTFHVLWVALLPRMPGFPWGLPVLGTDATLLTARPDFDSAVCGIAAGLAVRELVSGRSLTLVRRGLLATFVGSNLYAVATLETRAGLLTTFIVVAAALLIRPRTTLTRPSAEANRGKRRLTVGAVLVVAAVLTPALTLTPTGQRLGEGLSTTSSKARGTVDVRQFVWDKVIEFTARSPQRTAVGVGFGPNFIDRSGSRYALEGETYRNVRSPHNYLVGTLARLGVAGALLAALVLVLGCVLAVRALRTPHLGPIATLAALILLAMPLPSLLGVVMEAPFGALPYFWAVGAVSGVLWSPGRTARQDAAEST